MPPIDVGDFIMIVMTIIAVVTLVSALFLQRNHARYEATRPDAYAVMEASLASQQRRLDEMDRQRMNDHALIIELRNEVAALRAGVAVLIRQLQENSIEPQWSPAGSVPLPQRIDKAILARRLARYFNIDEMNTLMFNLGIDDEELSGDTRQTRARELVEYAERHDQLDVLATAVGNLRPGSK